MALTDLHEQNRVRLDAVKLVCQKTCGEAWAAVDALEPDARLRAAAAHHVLANPEDPVGVALAAGGGWAVVDREHLQLIHATVKGVAEGQQHWEAAGAWKSHVDLIIAAVAAHEPHRAELEAAYDEHDFTGLQVAAAAGPLKEMHQALLDAHHAKRAAKGA